MSWSKAMDRAAADKPRAAERGEIIVHPGQVAAFDDLDPGPAPVTVRERYEVQKYCPLFDGHRKETGKLFG